MTHSGMSPGAAEAAAVHTIDAATNDPTNAAPTRDRIAEHARSGGGEALGSSAIVEPRELVTAEILDHLELSWGELLLPWRRCRTAVGIDDPRRG